MPNISLTNISSGPVQFRDLYLTLAPGVSAAVFRSSAQLMSMSDLHHELAIGTVSMTITFTADEIASDFDPFPGLPAVVPVPSYGELFAQSNVGISISIPTAGSFVKWNSTVAGQAKNAPYVTPSIVTNDLTIGGSGGGIYQVQAHASFEGPNNEVFKWAVFLNGVLQQDLRASSTIPTGSGDRAAVALSGLASLNAGDVLDYRVTATHSAVTCLLYAANLNIVRVEESP